MVIVKQVYWILNAGKFIQSLTKHLFIMWIFFKANLLSSISLVLMFLTS